MIENLALGATVVVSFIGGYFAAMPSKKTVHPDTVRLNYLSATHNWLMYHITSESWGVVSGAGEKLVCARTDIRSAIDDAAKDSVL